MARKPLKTELLETVSVLTQGDITPPPIGDNSAGAGELMPTQAATHDNIASTLASIVENEKAIEYARQKLAHLLDERHTLLEAAAGDDVIVPLAHMLAINDTAFKSYLDALEYEFTVADLDKLKSLSVEERDRYKARVRRRLELALRLFVNLAWFRDQNKDAVCKWDADAGRWHVAPGAFIPPGFQAGGDLLLEKDGKTMRSFVMLESVEAAETYFVLKPKASPLLINLSLDQFNHAIAQTIAAMRNPTVDTGTVEATPSRQRRAARQTVAAEEAKVAAEEAAKQKAIDAETSDTPEATAPELQGDRAWMLGQCERLLSGIERCLDHDTLADVSWSDWSKNGYNAFTTIQMVIDRMNAKQDGKAKGKKAA